MSENYIELAWQPTDEILPGSHGQVAEPYRREVIHYLDQMADFAKLMAAMARAQPDDDESFGILDAGFACAWTQATKAYARFRDLRECSGQG